MAATAKMTVRVTKSRTASRLTASTNGTYASLPVNTIAVVEPTQPLYSTSSAKAFWQAVLADLTAAVNALP